MFITANEIELFKDKEFDPRLKAAIGCELNYLFLTDSGKNLTGVTARLVDMEKDPTSEEDGPFFVNLAIETKVPGLYVYLRKLWVAYVYAERVDGTDSGFTLVKADEQEVIEKIYEDIYGKRDADIIPFRPIE